MSTDLPGFEDLMALVQSDPDMKHLFSANDPRIETIRKRNQLAESVKEKYSQAVARVAKTPDGQLLFEALINMTFRRFDNITGFNLPMETAIQLHAYSDGTKDVVWQLLKLVVAGAENKPPK